MKWCDEGIYLLASQPVDKCQSQDGAEAALQEIEKFLETGAQNKVQELSKIYQDYEAILTQDLLVRSRAFHLQLTCPEALCPGCRGTPGTRGGGDGTRLPQRRAPCRAGLCSCGQPWGPASRQYRPLTAP